MKNYLKYIFYIQWAIYLAFPLVNGQNPISCNAENLNSKLVVNVCNEFDNSNEGNWSKTIHAYPDKGYLALCIAKARNDIKLYGQACAYFGEYFYERNQVDSAVTYLGWAKAHIHDLSPYYIYKIYHFLTLSYMKEHVSYEAMKYNRLHWLEANKNNDEEEKLKCLIELGKIYRDMEDYPKALKNFNLAEKMLKPLDENLDKRKYYFWLNLHKADLYTREGKNFLAEKYYKKLDSLEQFKEVKENFAAYHTASYFNYLLKMKRFTEADNMLKDLDQILEDPEKGNLHIDILMLKGEKSFLENNQSEAKVNWLKAITRAEAQNIISVQIKALEKLLTLNSIEENWKDKLIKLYRERAENEEQFLKFMAENEDLERQIAQNVELKNDFDSKNNQLYIQYLLIGLFVIGIITLFFLIRQYRKKQRAVQRNIRALNATSSNLLKANNRLTLLNLQVYQFVKSAAMEIKNSVVSIAHSMSVIETNPKVQEDETLGPMLNMVKDEADNLLFDINQLLTNVRASAYVTNDKEAVNLHSVIKLFERTRSVLLQSTRTKINPICDMHIRAHKFHIYQLLFNLLDNSIRHSEKNAPEITVSCEKQGNGVAIHYRDNSKGFSLSDIEKIQSNDFSKEFVVSYEPTKMGLFIVKRIIDFYDGTWQFNFDVEKGIDLTIWLKVEVIPKD